MRFIYTVLLVLPLYTAAQDFNGKRLQWNLDANADKRIRAAFISGGYAMGSESVTVAVENLTEQKLTATIRVTQTDVCGAVSEKKVTRTVPPLGKAGGSLWFDGYTFSTKCTEKKKYSDKFYTKVGNVQLELVSVQEVSPPVKTTIETKRDSMTFKYIPYKQGSGKKGGHLQGVNTRKHMGAVLKITAWNNSNNKTALENPDAMTVIEIKLAPGGGFNQPLPFEHYKIDIEAVPYTWEKKPGLIDKGKEIIREEVTSPKGEKDKKVKYDGPIRG
ncbi:hypothetical protein [Chitinophaga japonensis]|uniref:Uncharacterized protein n=1 Tax=Chitinophaga japonensis TaxID=104662 RepID=A0A562SZE0_CHIJA|nr:hypothetical protein [Chitinophaga japonensis]TWI86513.1 hypothetical protein LX66_3771 [Chitinophaga japonensis]